MLLTTQTHRVPSVPMYGLLSACNVLPHPLPVKGVLVFLDHSSIYPTYLPNATHSAKYSDQSPAPL